MLSDDKGLDLFSQGDIYANLPAVSRIADSDLNPKVNVYDMSVMQKGRQLFFCCIFTCFPLQQSSHVHLKLLSVLVLSMLPKQNML